MTIRNITSIANVALAVAVIALSAPMAHAQNGGYSAFGMYNNGGSNLLNSYNSGTTLGMYNNGGSNLLNAYNNGGSFYGYAPFDPGAFGVGPYRYNLGGALVLGTDGQLYDPFLGNGAVEPTINADGITVPAPVVPALVPTVDPTPIRTSDQIDAVRLSGNRVRIAWSGDQRAVATMTFSLLDKNRTALKSTILSDMPAQAVFTLPSSAAYYRVVITYKDGAMRSLVTAL